MAKYAFPAVFTEEDEGGYSIYFPDIEGCFTCADSIPEGVKMAEDALALMLYDYEKDKVCIPQPSPIKAVPVGESSFVNYIYCDTLEYQKRFNTKAVKKTLSIPEWLNDAAISAGVNFSQILQDALKAQLNLA